MAPVNLTALLDEHAVTGNMTLPVKDTTVKVNVTERSRYGSSRMFGGHVIGHRDQPVSILVDPAFPTLIGSIHAEGGIEQKVQLRPQAGPNPAGVFLSTRTPPVSYSPLPTPRLRLACVSLAWPSV
jgi:hypothetical protein